MCKNVLGDNLFSVHYINVMWKLELVEVGEIPEAWLMSPCVFYIISQEISWSVVIRLESV